MLMLVIAITFAVIANFIMLWLPDYDCTMIVITHQLYLIRNNFVHIL